MFGVTLATVALLGPTVPGAQADPMLNAVYDPSTPYAWAVNAHRQTKDTTVLVTYEGWGHGVYGRSACTTALVDEYLVTTRIPSVRRCDAVEPPTTTARPDLAPGQVR